MKSRRNLALCFRLCTAHGAHRDDFECFFHSFCNNVPQPEEENFKCTQVVVTPIVGTSDTPKKNVPPPAEVVVEDLQVSTGPADGTFETAGAAVRMKII